MDKNVKSVVDMINDLTRTIYIGDKSFNISELVEKSITDYEYNENDKISKVVETTLDYSSVSTLSYDENNNLVELTSAISGKAPSKRTFTYDDKNRCIKEESPYEIITREYKDKTFSEEIKNIQDEEINRIEYEINGQDEDDYRILSDIVYDQFNNEKKSIVFTYNDDENSYSVKNVIRDGADIIAEDENTYHNEKGKEAVIISSTHIGYESLDRNKIDGTKVKRQYINTYNDDFSKCLETKIYENDQLVSTITHNHTEDNGAKIEVISTPDEDNGSTNLTTIKEYEEDGIVYTETSGKLHSKDEPFKIVKLSANGYNVYTDYIPESEGLRSVNIETFTGDDKENIDDISISIRHNDLIHATFKSGNIVYSFDSIGKGYAAITLSTYDDKDLLMKTESFKFSCKDDVDNNIIDYIVSKTKEFISNDETIKLLLNKGGFDYEKIGGHYYSD